MDPLLRVALPLALFVAAHLGLAWPPLRERLVARLGRWGFTLLFSLVAWLTLGAAIAGYAAHAGAGPPGPALALHGAARAAAVAAITLGSALMLGGLAGYGRTPYAPSARQVREPRGLERVTRHPFFVGFALLGLAHALLASRLVGVLFFGGLALFALVGARLQDAKLLALRGEPYADYLAATSTLPFVAILAGRQRFVRDELPIRALLLGVALAGLLRALHAHLLDHGGLYLISVFVIGPLVLLVSEWRREHRAARPAAHAHVAAEPRS